MSQGRQKEHPSFCPREKKIGSDRVTVGQTTIQQTKPKKREIVGKFDHAIFNYNVRQYFGAENYKAET